MPLMRFQVATVQLLLLQLSLLFLGELASHFLTSSHSGRLNAPALYLKDLGEHCATVRAHVLSERDAFDLDLLSSPRTDLSSSALPLAGVEPRLNEHLSTRSSHSHQRSSRRTSYHAQDFAAGSIASFLARSCFAFARFIARSNDTRHFDSHRLASDSRNASDALNILATSTGTAARSACRDAGCSKRQYGGAVE